MQEFKAIKYIQTQEALDAYVEEYTADMRQALAIATEALEKLSRLGNEPHLGNSTGNTIAQHALKQVRQSIASPNPWKDALIDESVCCHIGWDENNPRKTLQDIISWHVAVALDPAVSSDAQALLAKGEEDMRARKDAAYLERNQVVAALAKAYPSGIAKTAIEGWSEDWHGCVYIDLPTGQASWHYHDSQAHLFAELPQYHGVWDGHTTEEKYERLAELIYAPPTEENGQVVDHDPLLALEMIVLRGEPEVSDFAEAAIELVKSKGGEVEAPEDAQQRRRPNPAHGAPQPKNHKPFA